MRKAYQHVHTIKIFRCPFPFFSLAYQYTIFRFRVVKKMYDDSWYSFVPESDSQRLDAASQGIRHRRRESLLKQPNVCAVQVDFKNSTDGTVGSTSNSGPLRPTNGAV